MIGLGASDMKGGWQSSSSRPGPRTESPASRATSGSSSSCARSSRPRRARFPGSSPRRARPRLRPRRHARADGQRDPRGLPRQSQRPASSRARARTRRALAGVNAIDVAVGAFAGGRRRPARGRGGRADLLGGAERNPDRGRDRRQRHSRPGRRPPELPVRAGRSGRRPRSGSASSSAATWSDLELAAGPRRPTPSSSTAPPSGWSRVEPKQAWTPVAELRRKGSTRSTSAPARPATRTARRAVEIAALEQAFETPAPVPCRASVHAHARLPRPCPRRIRTRSSASSGPSARRPRPASRSSTSGRATSASRPTR